MAETEKKHLKQREGLVISDKMDRTIVVRVDRRARHPVYGKVIKLSKKYYAHDESRKAKVGDFVRIIESRPLSKLKRWKLVEVITQAKVVDKLDKEVEVNA